MTLFFISLLSWVFTVLVTGCIYYDGYIDRRKDAIVFLTSFLWGWFTWAGIVLGVTALICSLPFLLVAFIWGAIKDTRGKE